jgi:hypothetical protein
MAEQEGSKAMTVYIVVCFVLAAGGLIGYKMMEDKRTELSGEYSALAGKIQDVGGALEPSIRDYYNKVQLGLIEPPDRETTDQTHKTLRQVAEVLGITAEQGNRYESKPAGPGKDKGTGKEKYKEYRCVVELRNVTYEEWNSFLAGSLNEVSKYAVIEVIDATRNQSRADKIEMVNGSRDSALWSVRVEVVWFGPMPT